MAHWLGAPVALAQDLGSVPGIRTYDGSQPSVSPVPGDPAPSSALHGYCMCVAYKSTRRKDAFQ